FVRRPTGAARVALLSAATLREHLADAAHWEGLNASGEVVPKHPPAWSVQAVFHRGEWPGLRYLVGVIAAPALRADGRVLSHPRSAEATALLYEPAADFPQVPEAPTRAEAGRAAGLLLDLVSQFPFVGDAHRGAWLAALLTAFARPAIAGPTPLFL